MQTGRKSSCTQLPDPPAVREKERAAALFSPAPDLQLPLHFALLSTLPFARYASSSPDAEGVVSLPRHRVAGD